MTEESSSEIEKRRDDGLRRALATPPKPHKSALAPKREGPLPPDGATDSEGVPADYSAPDRPSAS